MSKETLTEAQVEDIIYVGIRAWCAQQNPPLEFRDIEKYFCDLALAQIRGRGQAVMILNEDRVPEWLPPYDRPEPGTKLYAAQQPAQEPIGWLDWPSLEFRPNRNVKWCGPESVKFDPIPVFAALRQSGAGRDFIAKFEKIVKDESEQWKGVSDDTYGAQTACQMILQKIISLKERTK